MTELGLQALINRLIHEEEYRQAFATDREKCLNEFCLSEAEKLDLESLDLSRLLGALQSPARAQAAREVKGGSTI
jgi:hypothetical protein